MTAVLRLTVIAAVALAFAAADVAFSAVRASETETGWQVQISAESAGITVEILDWHLSSAYAVRGLGITASLLGVNAGGGATYDNGCLFVGGGVEAGGRMASDGIYIKVR